MPTRDAQIVWPLGGLDRSAGYVAQPPFTTPDSLNVRSLDSREGRSRGGSRPGLSKFSVTNINSSAIRVLGEGTSLANEASKVFRDDFMGSSGARPLWVYGHSNGDTEPSWTPIIVSNEWAFACDGAHINAALWNKDPILFNPLSSITITAYFSIKSLATMPADKWTQFRIYWFGNNVNPGVSAFGNYFAVRRTPKGTPKLWMGFDGALTEMTDITTGSETFTVQIVITRDATPSRVTATVTTPIRSTYPTAYTMTKDYGAYPTRRDDRVAVLMGFQEDVYPAATWLALGSYVMIYSYGLPFAIPTPVLYASNGGVISTQRGRYSVDAGTNWTAQSSGPQLTSNHNPQVAQHLSNLFIADVETAVMQNGSAWFSSSASHLDCTLTTDQVNQINANPSNYVCRVVPTDADIDFLSTGVYGISSVSTSLVILSSPHRGTPSNACTVTICAAPKYLDCTNPSQLHNWVTTALTLDDDGTDYPPFDYDLASFKGIMPLMCPLLARYMNCMVLGGAIESPNVFYLSRQGDPFDFDLSMDDEQAAWGGAASLAGTIGRPITALIPYGDDILIIAEQRKLWQLNGHPRQGGSIFNLDDTVGVAGKNAWCWIPERGLLFLSMYGLYIARPGSAPTPFSKRKMPVELIEVDTDLNVVHMQYDVRNECAHLWITPNAGGSGSHWWIELNNGATWKQQFTSVPGPYASLSTSVINDGESNILLGGHDGYIRRFTSTSSDDDGVAITSWVLLGPIALGGNPAYEGMLHMLTADLSVDSGSVAWRLFVADTADGAVQSAMANLEGTYFGNGTLAAGANYLEWTRARGSFAVLRLSATVPWMMEAIVMRMERLGLRRLN